ncbi:hypothetical protein chiPu_0014138 [Chiloscyllium punctatum]|uniref:Reverse transcriptase domain-containing protein n=1 Tax=Chiloscyllium punctatum TaxID=137246 RepID=A0A401SZ19_CHIPU|nr:hypothetical protein [Chiloscyllium punctatum]
MDDVADFCSDPLSVHRLMCICDQFEWALGAKVNRGKSEAMLFRNWADQSSIPITVRTDHLKVLGIWFGGGWGVRQDLGGATVSLHRRTKRGHQV